MEAAEKRLFINDILKPTFNDFLTREIFPSRIQPVPLHKF